MRIPIIDLKLFENFIDSKSHKTINGPAVMEFQYYLKNDRDNCGGSINRKIFTLRSYSHFLRLQDVPDAETLPFYDVLKIRQSYRNRPNALTTEQMKHVFDSINRDTILGIRDYAACALMSAPQHLKLPTYFCANPYHEQLLSITTFLLKNVNPLTIKDQFLVFLWFLLPKNHTNCA